VLERGGAHILVELPIDEKINGQLAFFPELENEQKDYARISMRGVPTPSSEQLDHWHFCIILSDILLRFDGELPEPWLYEILVLSDIMSYFMYMDALGALMDQQAVVKVSRGGMEYVTLTNKGRESVRQARLFVPKYFRDLVHLTALRYVSRQQALRDLQISCTEEKDDWLVSFTCFDSGREMMSLQIHAPSKESADVLSERILRNPARFFGKLLDIALTNEEEQYDLSDN